MLDSIYIFGVGLLAIAFIASIQIQGVNDLNPNLNYKTAFQLFISKAAWSFITSIFGIALYSILRKEIANVFITGNVTPSLVDKILGMQMFMGFLVAAGMQWGIYKFFFKKIDRIMKIWSGDTKTGAPDANTTFITPNVDGTLPKPPNDGNPDEPK